MDTSSWATMHLTSLRMPCQTYSDECELTAISLRAHIEAHGGLILRTLSYLTVNSQDDSHYELAVSFVSLQHTW